MVQRWGQAQRLGRLKAKLTEIEGAIQKLLDMVERSHMDLDDPALVEGLRQHKANRVRLNDEITLASSITSAGSPSITPPKLDRLSGVMREALKSGPV